MRTRLAATVLTAALAVTLSGCGDDPSGETDPAGEATPTGEATPDGTTTTGTPTTGSPSATQSPTAEATEGATVEMEVEGDRIEPNGQRVSLATGEPLVIEVESDRAGELHVHSTPEQEVAYSAGESRLELSFDRPGVVDIEDHDAGVIVFRVQVG